MVVARTAVALLSLAVCANAYSFLSCADYDKVHDVCYGERLANLVTAARRQRLRVARCAPGQVPSWLSLPTSRNIAHSYTSKT